MENHVISKYITKYYFVEGNFILLILLIDNETWKSGFTPEPEGFKES